MPTIVMTGGTSGFGAIAAGQLRGAPGTRIFIGARHPASDPGSMELDLTSLESVKHFAHALLSGPSIDYLVLNAGMIQSDNRTRTIDGFETTFAVNFLSQYLLLRLLLPHLSTNARIVMTTSGAHDPAIKAGLVIPRHANVERLAHPERDPQRESTPSQAAEHAYTASKLCVAMTVQYLVRERTVRERGIEVIAFDPGQVFGTGLARYLPPHKRLAWKALGHPLLGWPIRQMQDTLNTPESAGSALASLALGRISPPDGQFYVALRRGSLSWRQPSAFARDQMRANALWAESAALVGFSLPEPGEVSLAA